MTTIRLGLSPLLLAALLLSPAPAAAAEKKIQVAYSSRDIAFLVGAIAEKRGFFKDEGLAVELVQARVNVALSALVSGDLDYTLVFGSVIRGALKGLPLRVVAVSINRPLHFLIGRPEIRSVADLKGKIVAVSSFGATADKITRALIREEGLDPEKDVKFVALGEPAARMTALQQGVVHATVASPPAPIEAQKRGLTILASAAEKFEAPFTGLGTTEKKLKENRAEVKKMIRALLRASRFVRENKEETVKIMQDWLSLDREIAAASYEISWKAFSADGGISEKALQQEVDQTAEEMNLPAGTPVSRVADFSLLDEVQRDLGVKK